MPAISLVADGVNLSLPEDLEWIDEFKWSPIEQKKEYLSEGALLVEEGFKQAGRPITLVGGQYVLAAHEAAVNIQDEISQSLGKTYTLTLNDGRSFSVMFDHEKGAIEAPVHKFFRKRVYDSNTKHEMTLRFITV